MHRLRCFALCATLLCPSPLLAATVFRCEDPGGHITFTLQGCSEAQDLQLHRAHNPTPGSGQPVPLAQTGKTTRTRSQAKPSAPLVVGEQGDGCGNRVTGSARRTAMIRQQVLAGMTRSDVESALGKPDKISTQNGRTRYHYRDREGSSRQISFDDAGCVKGKP
ncbi:DUF4124 domain-containing protein [Pseudomonas lalucatii]|uniref:DUF4124 domain-containing protein n=1 Tax=Pseudomonas lalucatii TaxID=1424203 RepID=A0ABS5Q4B2_9PSED|nr:DUF4124 domain-containing protein [Pseudomonas lalucatii]MBS7663138.1 DUF4124 domain-containing protein [Pseudomonas lalucatii]MBS7690001.1 DUF4124 domain-containing protein [Pseudomonas lalucatii]MBS7724849.1 DUF4124 domain-containing protein [Pseudomonas lalucatii]QVM87179.1 DUF4124 domain-containing protein [Pseudomonas lalucatii]